MSKIQEERQLLFRLEAIPVFYPIATFSRRSLLKEGRRRKAIAGGLRFWGGTRRQKFDTGDGRNSPSR